MIDEMKLSDTIDLSPAKWIWFPSERTLPNTFALFRKDLHIAKPVASAKGWISADSRYLFTVNGQRVQWGPAPCDPRHMDADPLDLKPFLQSGINSLGTEVLFYGNGEGTWVAGKPGLLIRIEICYEDHTSEWILSDRTWSSLVDRAHRPGQYPRWYIRALQEDFDARLHPNGWNLPDYQVGPEWVEAYEIPGRSDKPTGHQKYVDYLYEFHISDPDACDLRKRLIPLLKEHIVPVSGLSESGFVQWKRNPHDWFDFRMPDSFEVIRTPAAMKNGNDHWVLPETGNHARAVFALFELEEEITGFPYFTVEASEGTVIELIWHEAHDPANTPWLDTYFYHWARYTCKEGINRFELFDYEALRWIQLHVRNHAGPVKILEVGVRRRCYDWPNKPNLIISEPKLQALFDACFNTIENLAQGTLQADAARERQQYSLDGSRPLFATRYAYGDMALSRRYIGTFGYGSTHDGYLMDAWPAIDRLKRIWTRLIDGSVMGPILEASLYFILDCWQYYQDTGDSGTIREIYGQLQKIAGFFIGRIQPDGLLPVERVEPEMVWMDHLAYKEQRHKRCAYNLLAAAVFKDILPVLTEVAEDALNGRDYRNIGEKLHAEVIRRYWSEEEKRFVNNLPEVKDAGEEPCLDDLSLSFALYFDLNPDGAFENALNALVESPKNLGLSFASNLNWKYWALAKCGRADILLNEFRSIWAELPSVKLNRTMPEFFDVKPDGKDEWSHNAISPLYCLYMNIAGIRSGKPGFETIVIRPQLCDIESLSLTFHTPKGPVYFSAKKTDGGHSLIIDAPVLCEVELQAKQVLSEDVVCTGEDVTNGLNVYALPKGKKNEVWLASN